MNYLTEERMNALAASYVLGSLRGLARARFQKLLLSHRSLRECVWRWEAHLNALAMALPVEKPRRQVWQTIENRLGFNNNVTELKPANSKPATSTKASLWPWAMAASIVIGVLAFNWQMQPPSLPAEVAVVQNGQAKALWLIELDDKQLSVQVTGALEAKANKDYELWMLPPNGEAPISLGILPKTGELNLNRHPLFDQVKISTLAVSLEPLGGSPNGSPTEVLYTADLINRRG